MNTEDHISSWKGKRIYLPFPVIIGNKTLPAGWIGDVLRARDNGVGNILLSVCLDATGEVVPLFERDVEVLS